MKKIKNLLYMVLAGGVFTLTSCSDDIEREPSPIPTDGAQAYIYMDKTDLTYTPSEDQVFTLKVARQKTDAAATVHLSTDATDITVPATVDFAAGEGSKDVKIAFNLELGKSGTYTITVADADAYVYGNNKVTVNIKRDYTWLSLGNGVYTSQLFGEGWEQPILKAKEGNVYRLPDCLTKGYPIEFTLSEDGQSLEKWDIQPTGYDKTNYGMLYFKPASMTRSGNVLSFNMQGLVQNEGKWGILYKDFTETLEFPAE